MHFNLTADFDQSIFFGWAYHTMEIVDSDVTLAQFDIWDLTIDLVYVNGIEATMSILTPNEKIGQVLQIVMPTEFMPYNVGDEINISIKYQTSPSGQAFSWLTKD